MKEGGHLAMFAPVGTGKTWLLQSQFKDANIDAKHIYGLQNFSDGVVELYRQIVDDRNEGKIDPAETAFLV